MWMEGRQLFPAHAGMNRYGALRWQSSNSVPRTRGDAISSKGRPLLEITCSRPFNQLYSTLQLIQVCRCNQTGGTQGPRDLHAGMPGLRAWPRCMEGTALPCSVLFRRGGDFGVWALAARSGQASHPDVALLTPLPGDPNARYVAAFWFK